MKGKTARVSEGERVVLLELGRRIKFIDYCIEKGEI
jgi:hypothetical protein